MSLEVIETGEVVEPLSRVEAERLTARIADKLDSIADNLEQVLPLIGEALTRDAWKALFYSSPTAYVSDRFAGALTRLPREIRQPVVSELSTAGMSTRAIAPIVGADNATVHRDLGRVANATPEPRSATFQSGGSFVSPGEEIPVDTETVVDLDTHEVISEKIIGMDGKQYNRPEPTEPATPKRRPLPDQFFTAVYDLRKNIERLTKLTEDDRYPQNKDELALTHESDLNRATDALNAVLQTMNNK